METLQNAEINLRMKMGTPNNADGNSKEMLMDPLKNK